MTENTTIQHKKHIMCIGRSDCLGYAGIQTDIQTVLALGNYPTTVVTSVYAGPNDTPYDVNECTTTLIVRQMEEIIQTSRPDCVKIGRLYSGEQMTIIERTLRRRLPDTQIVLAPILFDRDHNEYVSVRALSVLKQSLAVHTNLLILSHDEAESLTGTDIRDEDSLEKAVAMILSLGCQTILISSIEIYSDDEIGSDVMIDVFASADGIERLDGTYRRLIHSLGVKTRLASACASYMADGLSIKEAVIKGRLFTYHCYC